MDRFLQSKWIPLIAALAAMAPLPTNLRAEDKPLRAIVDAEVRAAWQREKITPAGRAGDAAFLRRIYLDLVGTIPSHDETQQFLKDTNADKRAKLIDTLLADERFAAQQANVWSVVLFGRKNSTFSQVTRRYQDFKEWLAEKFAHNEPYDSWVRELLRAEGDGPALFYAQYKNQAEEAAVAVSRIFLGTQLQCARCHDHPFENWTQRDFYGMAGFFVRLTVVDKPAVKGLKRFTIGEKSSGEVLFTGAVKDQKPGQKGEPIKAKFLGGVVVDEPPLPKGFKEPASKSGKAPPPPLFSRKEKLADWIASADNPYFARAIVNRLWAQFLGKGLVQPIDDLRDSNDASHPELLQTMTVQLIKHKFDLKWLIRELVNSATYQLSSEGVGQDASPHWYERARVRPLSAEELFASVLAAAGNEAGSKTANNTRDYFLRYFGSPVNGRGEFQGGLAEHLFLNNSQHILQMIQRRKGNLADQLLASKEPWEKRVDRLFLSVLTRPPSAAERGKFTAYLSAAKNPESSIKEAIWVLLNTAEFRFNH